MEFFDREIQSVVTKLSELETPRGTREPADDSEDNTIEYRATSHYHTQSTDPSGKSFVRTSAIETTKRVSNHGDPQMFNQRITLMNPDNLSGEVLVNHENNRAETLKKLKSSFLSQMNETGQKDDPFARFGTRSMIDGNLLQDKNFIEIHKFPFAEPFSTPNSIRKEQVSYTTTSPGKSDHKISITKTEFIENNKKHSIIETTEDLDDVSTPKIKEVKE